MTWIRPVFISEQFHLLVFVLVIVKLEYYIWISFQKFVIGDILYYICGVSMYLMKLPLDLWQGVPCY